MDFTSTYYNFSLVLNADCSSVTLTDCDCQACCWDSWILDTNPSAQHSFSNHMNVNILTAQDQLTMISTLHLRHNQFPAGFYDPMSVRSSLLNAAAVAAANVYMSVVRRGIASTVEPALWYHLMIRDFFAIMLVVSIVRFYYSVTVYFISGPPGTA